jgi:hypothetical protein
VLVGCGGASASPEDVVRAWSDALADGNGEAAAKLFAANARFVAGDSERRLETYDDALALNTGFRCAGRVVRLTRTAGYVTAMLAARHVSRCGGGEWGSVDVRVRDGKIVELIQIGA